MSTGETIQCRDLDEAIKCREKLMENGYSVDLEYTQAKAVLKIIGTPKE